MAKIAAQVRWARLGAVVAPTTDVDFAGELFEDRYWTAADGRSIRIGDLEPGHLVNILNWVWHDNRQAYSPAQREHWLNEVNRRALVLFSEGKAYPCRGSNNKWSLVEPGTGKTFITPPPQEYYDRVKEVWAGKESKAVTKILAKNKGK